MFPAARMGDTVTHDQIVPSGAIIFGMPTVMIDGSMAARMTDPADCSGAITGGVAHPPLPPTPPLVIAKGKANVLVGGLPIARWIIDTTICGAFLGDIKQFATRKTFVGP